MQIAGLNINCSEEEWEHTFYSSEDKARAEKILRTLAGMDIFSARELLESCKQCLLKTVIRECE